MAAGTAAEEEGVVHAADLDHRNAAFSLGVEVTDDASVGSVAVADFVVVVVAAAAAGEGRTAAEAADTAA